MFKILIIIFFLQILIIQGKNKTLIQKHNGEFNKTKELINHYPVIGILTLPSGFQKYNHTMYSYIYTSYVQYFQQSQARIIPLKYTDSLKSLRYKMKRINGLVIPGGGVNLMQRNNESGDKEFTKFAEVGKYLINMAKRINRQGEYFPVWGTCLGFELLVLSFTKSEVRSQFQGENRISSFSLSQANVPKSRLFKNIPIQIKETIAQQKEVFYFNHKNGFKIQKFLNHGVLKNHFYPLAYSSDMNGKRFVSIAEAKQYPFYGVQFHPEKLQYEWSQQYSKQISMNEINIVQYFANFFFQECLKNKQRFNSTKNMTMSLIENYKLTYLKGFEQGIYLFNNEGKDQFKIIADYSNSQNQFIEDKEDNTFKQHNTQKTQSQQHPQKQQHPKIQTSEQKNQSSEQKTKSFEQKVQTSEQKNQSSEQKTQTSEQNNQSNQNKNLKQSKDNIKDKVKNNQEKEKEESKITEEEIKLKQQDTDDEINRKYHEQIQQIQNKDAFLLKILIFLTTIILSFAVIYFVLNNLKTKSQSKIYMKANSMNKDKSLDMIEIKSD